MRVRKPDRIPTIQARRQDNNVYEMIQIVERSGAWLTDDVINHSQSLLHNQFSGLDGFQDMGVVTAAVFVGTPVGNYIQILNVHRNHWITVSNINCFDGEINIYDSMAPGLDYNAKRSIAWMMYHPGPYITLQWPQIHKQDGGDDCGLFAIANATALCYGFDPTQFSWQQGAMRAHLKTCINDGRMTMFPCKRKRRGGSVAKTQKMKLFCHCRQPEVGQTPMIQCCTCKSWYHGSCDNVPDIAWTDDDYRFVCTKCST